MMKEKTSRRLKLAAILMVICMLLTGVGAAALAAGFSDAESIKAPYTEAVENMTDRGVLNGFPDGSFRPEETLTREQGAKIVAYIVLGEKVNDLKCSAAPFDDVAADRWSAPCIAWCVGREILLGYGDGTYGPDDTLTGDQFAKMLLCTLSLARDGNYVGLGSAWYSAVREDAGTAKLYDGDAGMETERPITRQQAALMAWNAIKAAEAAQTPASSGGGASSSGGSSSGQTNPSQPGGSGSGGNTEEPGIETDPVPAEPGGEGTPGEDHNNNGDIVLPEIP